jgi:hypothetical protein
VGPSNRQESGPEASYAKPDLHVAAMLEASPIDCVEVVGPGPKGISHEVSLDHDDGSWRCRVLVDV